LDWKEYVKVDQRYFRPNEVDLLLGDPTKAKKQLNWFSKVLFKDLVKIMVDADLMEIGLDPKNFVKEDVKDGILGK
jgi:GDPmannose 4,6-dehydratase